MTQTRQQLGMLVFKYGESSENCQVYNRGKRFTVRFGSNACKAIYTHSLQRFIKCYLMTCHNVIATGFGLKSKSGNVL